MRNVTRLSLLAVLLLSWALPATGDDSDIFLVNAVEPNVVILIDSSGSMSGRINGVRKIDSAKMVVNSLINNVEGVRIGVWRFNGNSDGGLIVAPIDADPATKVTLVSSITPNGWTPLGRAAQTIQDYFLGTHIGAECVGECLGNLPPPAAADDDDDDDDTPGETWTPTITYTSPIQYECQKNYAIIITDGMPNGEPESLVTDVATSLFNTDHSPLPGVQNVIVHTVGFDVPAGTALLTATATAGGGNFYTAGNAKQLEFALQDAIASILQDTYSFAAPVIPSTSVSGGTLAYFASFEPHPVRPFWNGHLRAFTRDSDGRIPLDTDGLPDATALAWDAGQLLAARTAASRTIYTVISGNRQTFVTTNGAVTPASVGMPGVAEKNQLVGFVRGTDTYDSDVDGNVTEEREWKLGDIFHSTPVLVFPPPLNSPDSDYDTFKTNNASRETVLLVGANDGMLHAFRASDGVELWAVIPPDLLNSLSDMTGQIGTHPYYVDATPVIADVKTSGSWKTIVLVASRRGGSQYHAFNISDTTNPTYLWSFSDAELGETWSMPQIGKVKISDGSERYVAVVGGGYNTPGNNTSGRALFVIDLANGNKLWEYKTGGAADAAYMNFSVASNPSAVDLDRDGFIDRVYVGDVAGQIWKFDLSPAAVLSGGVVTNWTGKRLFVAAAAETNPPAAGEFYPAQGMYGSPTAAYDAYGSLWVLVGSGDRNHPKSAAANRFYAISDDTTMTNGSALTEASLVDVTSGDAVSQGWYYLLPANEKVLAKAEVFNNFVFFTAYLPNSADVCDSTIGGSNLYALQLADGQPTMDWSDGSSSPYIPAGDGIATEPDILLGDTADTIVIGTTDGQLTEEDMDPNREKKILYWREVMESPHTPVEEGTQPVEEEGTQPVEEGTNPVQEGTTSQI